MPSESPLPEPFTAVIAESARVFLAAVDAVAAGNPRGAARMLDKHVGTEPRIAALRCRSLTAVAPVIACHGVAELHSQEESAEFWTFEIDDNKHDPAGVAAMQVITAHLNADVGAARDVLEALGRTSGYDALIDLVVIVLRLCVSLKHQGASLDTVMDCRTCAACRLLRRQ